MMFYITVEPAWSGEGFYSALSEDFGDRDVTIYDDIDDFYALVEKIKIGTLKLALAGDELILRAMNWSDHTLIEKTYVVQGPV